MLRYVSKLFLDIFLSVLATVAGSYLAHQYIASWSAANAPVSLAGAAVDPKRGAANAVPHAAAKADLTLPQAPSDLADAPEPLVVAGGQIVDKTNDGKAASAVDKPAEPASIPARLHRSTSGDKHKTNASVTSEVSSLTIASPGPVRATADRFFGANTNPPPDGAVRLQEIDRDNGLSSSPGPRAIGAHLAGRILKPFLRAASVLFEPSSAIVDHDQPRERASFHGLRFSSRALRDQPELTDRPASQRMPTSHDARRPETKTAGQWP